MHRADDCVRLLYSLGNAFRAGQLAVSLGKQALKKLELLRGFFKDGGCRADSQCDLRRRPARIAAAEDNEFCRHRVSDRTCQNALSAGGSGEVVGGYERCHLSRHLAHGREQRQLPILCFNGFISHTGHVCLDHGFGQGPAGGKVKEREENLPGFEQGILRRQRLFYFQNQVGPLAHGGGARRNFSTGAGKDLIADTAGDTGPGFNDDLMTVGPAGFHAVRGNGDPVFIVFNLF